MSSFHDFKKIEIPIIQRDYVQAREDDEKANEVIDKFLDDLYIALKKEKKKFHLDFVYGYDKDDIFIPIDGQQRLTTLFLIHWYLAKKEHKDIKTILTYETRVSSREFCEFLLSIELENKKNLSNEIVNHKKFNPYWSDDPTIKSMLKVLDKIEKKQKEKPLKYEDLKYISFEKFDMVDFGEIQAEELYRKMNSRGKALTAFENFKSIYEKIAYSMSKDIYKKIAVKFEKAWIGYFWIVKDDIKVIDDNIMNFIYFLTEMRCYETQQFVPENIKSFKFLEEFWSIQENFDFFERVFDNLATIKTSSVFIKDNLAFFDTNERTDLFMESIANKKINTIHKGMLYILILSVLQNKNNSAHLDLMRIVRNVLNINSVALRGAGKISYDQTLGVDAVINLLPSFKKLISDNPYDEILKIEDKKLKPEQEKARLLEKHKAKIFKLEDYKYIKGDLRLLLDIADIETIYKYIIIDGIFEKENLNKTIRAILSCGDYRFGIGNVKGGNKYFYGSEGYMEIFLTKNSKSERVEEILKDFFEKLKANSQDELINSYLKKSKIDWKYYFVKYPVVFDTDELSNVFGWMKWDEENDSWSSTFVEKLEKHTTITQQHINIYVYILLRQLKKDIDFDCIEFDEIDFKTVEYNNDIKITIKESCLMVNNKKFALFENTDAIENMTAYVNTVSK